jgi:hypothetical protein
MSSTGQVWGRNEDRSSAIEKLGTAQTNDAHSTGQSYAEEYPN